MLEAAATPGVIMSRKRRAAISPAPASAGRPNRRTAIVLTLTVALGGVAAAIWIAARLPRRPNIVLITIDTLRADHLGSYGYARADTPVLDALARDGVRFSEVIAQAPLTLPSHASIFTGLTPPRHGVRNNPDSVVPASIPTLAERFHAAGYATAAFVSGFPLHKRFGLARGFDVYDDRFPRGDGSSAAPFTERRADQTVAAVRAWFSSRNRDVPFFLWVHLFDPHRPYDPPEPFRSRFADAPYDGEIAFVDAQIGELRHTLSNGGADTIVVVASDHGEGLNEHGEPTHGLFVYDSTIRVPLIVAAAGLAAGRVVATPVRLVDVPPTLLELAALAPLPQIDGRSLAPALGSRAATLTPEPAYVESLFGRLCCGWAPLHGWRDGRWMFIDAPEPELYDVTDDPIEQHNVADLHAAEVARFQRAARAAAAAPPVDGGRANAPPEASERLAALGYFSGSANVPASLADPKRMAALAERMEQAIARERSDPAGAASELRSVVGADPSNALARRHLAIALAAMHEYDAAIEQARTLVQMGDDSSETTVLLGDCQRLTGDVAGAIRTLKAAERRDSSSTELTNALGRALATAADRAGAAAAFTSVLARQPDDPDALEALADMAIERGDLAEGRARLEQLLARDPEDSRVGVKLSAVLARSGRTDAAIQLLRSIADRAPTNVDAQVNLAAALAKGGAPAEAIRYFERAIASGARAPVVLNGLAMARLQTGDPGGAADALRRSLAINPDQPDIRNLLEQVQRR